MVLVREFVLRILNVCLVHTLERLIKLYLADIWLIKCLTANSRHCIIHIKTMSPTKRTFTSLHHKYFVLSDKLQGLFFVFLAVFHFQKKIHLFYDICNTLYQVISSTRWIGVFDGKLFVGDITKQM